MHNFHFGRMNADSHKEASEKIEARLSTWGGDNNWFAICGSSCIEE